MYAKPRLIPLDAASSRALCCHIRVGELDRTTPLCAVPFCQVVEPCSVAVGPIAVTGPISTPTVVVPPFSTPPIQAGPIYVGPVVAGPIILDSMTFAPITTPGVSISG